MLAKTLAALLAARTSAEAVFGRVRRKEASRKAAEEALSGLESDVAAALEPLGTWAEGRTFLLFPAEASSVQALAQDILVEGRLHAAVCGVEVQVDGGPRVRTAGGHAGAFTRYAAQRGEVAARVEELKGFLAEEGTLDRRWRELGERMKRQAAEREAAAKGGSR
ncbi:MAG: hypothetical protein D6731_23950 [Planctomycetota bacterium]|nr:MAG: hypothetical protein D6731_23950 [Planctomycetota bacterium]